ncbi:MAG TPA: class I SAM-dependent methyltransferase [Sedimentisphaerales bacterium]|nr:class I SAM-dependent methyltransferase [Sedimentisphaerales bacterium]
MATNRDKKTVSREVGLEIGSICGQYFLELDHLHYGYWTPDLEVKIANVGKAQNNYVKFLLSHIPDGVKTILDVGCGSGHTTKELLALGYKVDCVSPSHFLAEKTKKLVGDRVEMFECFYEDIETDKKYDLVLFSESFQYMKVDQALQKTCDLLNPNGRMLISDIFKKDVPNVYKISGGHSISKFEESLSHFPFELLEEVDITNYTAPNIDLISDMSEKVVQPVIVLVEKFLDSRAPFTSKCVKWIFRKKIAKIEKKYSSNTKTGENFKKCKVYKLMLFKKTN